MKIIGIGHKAKTGKSTVAKLLKNNLNRMGYAVDILSFADSLKEYSCASLNITLKELEQNKSVFRPFLQWYGTDFMRNYNRTPDIWIEELKSRIKEDLDFTIIPDVRFLNEACYILNTNGILIKTNRANSFQVNQHISETELNNFTDWDFIINNNESLDVLNKVIIELIDKIMLRK